MINIIENTKEDLYISLLIEIVSLQIKKIICMIKLQNV